MIHPTFKLGMHSDDAVRIIKLTGRRHLQKPVSLGESEYGYIARWYIQDATLTLRRLKHTRDGGYYEITEIAPPIKVKSNGKDNS